MRALGERAEGRAGLILIETLRTMTLSTMAELSMREEPATPEELWPSLALVPQAHRGYRQAPPGAGAARRRRRRQEAAAKARARRRARHRPRKGLSPETVDLIDEAVVGFRFRPRPPVTSAPVDPWNPAESHESQLIPLNPGESRPENVSGVSSFISLNGGRALRTCGPAAVRNSPPKARGFLCQVMAGLARTRSGLVPAIRLSGHP